MKIIKLIISVFIVGLSVSLMLVSFFLYTSISKLKPLDLSLLYQTNHLQIYDKDDVLITNFGNNQEHISYQDMSKYLLDACVAIEDERFYTHNGIDYKRIFSAAINNSKNLEFKEGASTITQQVIKNIYLSPEKSITRKVQELYLATKLEKKLSKQQILEVYLNNILFGKQLYGIKAASNYYYSKDPTNLTLSQAATLVGMVQLPNYYNPITNEEPTTNRRNLVLKKMLELNYINNEEYKLAYETKISDEIKITSYYHNYKTFASYVDQVLYELNENYTYPKGSKIYTNYDHLIQQDVTNIINDIPYENLKSGIVIMDNEGKVLALGGYSKDDIFGVNYVRIKLQPGSTIKPILDYAPAIEYLGYGTGSMILDEEMDYATGQKINNWDLKYKGLITLRKALVESRNIPSIKLYDEVGHNKAFNFASKLGIIPEDEIFQANAIGGFKNGYTVLEMTNAYQAFANNGTFSKAHTIRKINNTNIEIEKQVAMNKTTAFMINDILSDVSTSFLGYRDNRICAKTGQTNYDTATKIKFNIPMNATKDSWYITYTPDRVIGTWIGYDVVSSKTYLDFQKMTLARSIGTSLIQTYTSNKKFQYPQDLLSRSIDVKTGKLADKETPYQFKRNEYYLSGTEPH